MDPRFDEIARDPQNGIFHIVFFPDRVYHASYLNATRSPRYRYDVQEVRSKLDVSVSKGSVFREGYRLGGFVRIEYRASRLVELVRERGRFVRDAVAAWVKMRLRNGSTSEIPVTRLLKLHYDRFIDAYQVELWETLEPPPGVEHDVEVSSQMGHRGPITRVADLAPALASVADLRQLELAFTEEGAGLPVTSPIADARWDNNYGRTHQEPRTQEPSSADNTVPDLNYLIDFRRGWFLDASKTEPVRYRNAMMDDDNPDRRDDNIIEMRWMLQRELGSGLVFFHEVLIPPGKVEGTHQHVGSEEMYYIVSGEGIAYMAEGDDPATDAFPTVERHIFGGLGKVRCKELPVKPGNIIYTKSGGIHGIRNDGATPLKFVAYLYHSS